MKYIGIYAKNREEWVLVDLAAGFDSAISVSYYDTLGPDSVSFVTNQTGLTTIACSNDKIANLAELKTKGDMISLKNIIAFDQI